MELDSHASSGMTPNPLKVQKAELAGTCAICLNFLRMEGSMLGAVGGSSGD